MQPSTVETASRAKIRTALPRYTGGLGADLVPLFRIFVDKTLGYLRGPFLAHHSPTQALQAIEEAFLWSIDRAPGSLKVEVAAGPERGVRIRALLDDQPFIIDTIRLFLKSGGADFGGGFSLIYKARRDASGRILSIGDDDGVTECVALIDGDAGSLTDDLPLASRNLTGALELARATVRDFKAMHRVIDRWAEKFDAAADRQPERGEPCRETAAFLRWVLNENFVLMGLDNGEPLGVQTVKGPVWSGTDGDWPAQPAGCPIQVRKSHIESPVHRAGRIDEILVKLGDETLFIRGMFTYRAITQQSRHVPILRKVLAELLATAESSPGSFRYKGIANVFDSLPTEFLFTARTSDLMALIEQVMQAELAQEVIANVTLVGNSGAFALAAMPKPQYNEDLRRVLEDHLKTALGATYSDHGVFVGRYDTVLVYYFLTGVQPQTAPRLDALTAEVRGLAAPWALGLWQHLADRFGEDKADRLLDTYGRAFPTDWARQNPPSQTVQDIALLESLDSDRKVLAKVISVGGAQAQLRLYQSENLFLSTILPVLANFGLVVQDSMPTLVAARGGTLWIDTFVIAPADVTLEVFRDRQNLLAEGLEAVFSGHIERDGLNRLTLRAGLDWRGVDVVRGYIRYLRQLNVKLSDTRIEEILLSNPIMTHSLVEAFNTKFNPDLQGDRTALMAQADQLVKDELRLIIAHDEFLLFTSLYELLQATVRTNAFRTDRTHHYLSFKFLGEKVSMMGANRPMFEIYVHNNEVEGVHLRFGKVARGGIRSSDRDDFRTEVLGLVTTQRVKNVIIVPTGSKGGYFVKNASRDMKVRRSESDRLYKTFIRGLLDLTDNAVGAEVVPPPRVVRHDPPDPYLVVAADKGTAHLSDTANGLAQDYGFWIGDAFASGGSVGYDHKKVGITARGGWVLVRRHFKEMGRDPYKVPFTAVGVGDMSGDVFGNGLIESPHTRLLAAFNHLHIFLDPNPDAARSYEERLRLFKAEAKGEWAHYDRDLISAGGGVFERRLKAIPLSPEARAMLGIDAEEAPPEVVIQHILRMQVDLLWNGGIGTYVKASSETHAQADDRGNDVLRVSANELRCQIVGEGGNLGFTQAARIEAAQRGIRLNTDAIDNSGGVDLSDHEVNLKILLAPVVAAGRLTTEARNQMLMEMTSEVADLVLADNDANGRLLSRDVVRSQADLFQFGRCIGFVERVFGKTRASLALPNDEELQRRVALGQGLTRPELSVLSAWVKMYVKNQLLADSPKKLPGYGALLTSYFPKRVQKDYAKDVPTHMLADDIAVAVASNGVMADAGTAFVPMMVETTGSSVIDIACAFLNAQRLAEVDKLRAIFEPLDTTVPLDLLNEAWVIVDAGTREVARFWLSASSRLPKGQELDEMAKAADEIFPLHEARARARYADLVKRLESAGVPADGVRRILRAITLNTILTVWNEARNRSLPPGDVLRMHLAIAQASGIQRVLDEVANRPSSGPWDPIASRILYNRFYSLLRQVVSHTQVQAPTPAVEELVPALQEGALKEVRAHVDELFGAESPSVATLLVLEERVASAVGRLSVRP